MKRVAIVLLQLFVSAAGLFYVFHNPHTRQQAIDALRHSRWNWLLIGWCFYAIVEVAATVRWQILLRIQGITLGWLRAWAIVVLGLFFNMFLPGLVGGDVVRLYIVFKHSPKKKTPAALSVVMDRLLGLISILLLAVTVVLFRFDWLSRFPETKHVSYAAVGLLAVSAVAVFFLFALARFGLANRLPAGLPFRKPIVRATKAVNLYRAHFGRVGIALLLTIVSHLTYYLSFYSAMRSLAGNAAHKPTVLDFVSVMPLVNTITGLPISFGGAGVRETLFQTFFSRLTGLPEAIAASSASLGFSIQASWGIIGAVTYWMTQRAQDKKN